ncbi:hypothetical protein IFM89_002169 [Coptis chinensis]|uniref:F-box domain-containing protein n=1 Tax=Coptis chinensis TaxID=261450 RepID=A0A835I9R0_9MAGN|nr:hypothetical protein IFM89_002169 [Coptis chinensis]
MPLANTFKALPRLTFSVLCCGRSDQEAMESQDRISDLPDSMLLHILSFLSMKEVVLTGVLSKRWDHLWTKAMHLRYLGPRITTSYKEDKERFFKFVIHTLHLRETNPIEEFSLDFPLSEHSPLEITILSIHVFTWIHFAVKRKVKIICLDFSNNDYFLRSQIPFKLPSPLFSCDSVKWLSLAYCIIDRDRQISWNSLGELCLKEVRLSDDVVQKILSGAPLLVELTLYFCTGMENLNITSRNLKILHLSLTSQSKLSISAPYLRTLEIRGGVARYNLMKVSSLSMVKIFPGMAIIGSSHQDKLERLLQSVQHAQYLTLSSHCLQVVFKLHVFHKRPADSSKSNYKLLS